MNETGLSDLHAELGLLETETFEIAEPDLVDDLPFVSTTSTTSATTSSCG